MRSYKLIITMLMLLTLTSCKDKSNIINEDIKTGLNCNKKMMNNNECLAAMDRLAKFVDSGLCLSNKPNKLCNTSINILSNHIKNNII